MGITASLIKRHIFRLSPDEIFCTRDLLAYGKRSNIDNLLHRMVKRGEIRRLANGVFARTAYGQQEFSPLQVLTAKMHAYGKVFWNDLRERISHGHAEIRVRVAGGTSSFRVYTGHRIVLQGTGPRKMKLGQTPAGRFARSLWDAGPEDLTTSKIRELMMLWSQTREDSIELLLSFNLLPAWLNDLLFGIRRVFFKAGLGHLNLFSTAVQRVEARSIYKDRVVYGSRQSTIAFRHTRFRGKIPVKQRF